MDKNIILSKLLNIGHQPLLKFNHFMNHYESNALKTLDLLASNHNVTATTISEYLDIAPSSVSKIVQKLKDLNFINLQKSNEDARITYITLTNEGTKFLTENHELNSTFAKDIFNGLSDQELQNLNKYLDKIQSNISSKDFQDKIYQTYNDENRWKCFEKISSDVMNARKKMLEKCKMGCWYHHMNMKNKMDNNINNHNCHHC